MLATITRDDIKRTLRRSAFDDAVHERITDEASANAADFLDAFPNDRPGAWLAFVAFCERIGC